MRILAPSTRAQKLGVTFFLAACASGVLYSYLFAYHILPPGVDRKFPTPWRVFEFNLNIWIVVVLVYTAVFGSLVHLLRPSDNRRTHLRDHLVSISTAISACSGAFWISKLGGFVIVAAAVILAGSLFLRKSSAAEADEIPSMSTS